jgi:polygalacturonase
MTDRGIHFLPQKGEGTAALQAAIDTAATTGKRLTLAAGDHHTAGLTLRNGLDLHLAAGARLVFSPDYDAYAGNCVGVIAEGSDRALIHGIDLHGVTISGPGTIVAPGPAYVEGRHADMGTLIPARLRPRVLVLEACTDIRLEGFSVLTSPMWTLHLVACRDVVIENLTVDNDRTMPNTDGLVLDACQTVTVRDSRFLTADDGVVLKTSRGPDGKAVGACRDVTVEHCTIESQSCALKIGTESYGPFEHITFSDCRVVGSNRALGIFSRDGGAITDVTFRRITLETHETPDGFWGSGEAITVNTLARRAAIPPGNVTAVTFEDIDGAHEGAINLYADTPGEISNVTLRRIHLVQRPGRFATAAMDLRPTGVDLAPQAELVGWANAWIKGADGKVIGLMPYPGGQPALYARNIDTLILDAVTFERPDPLPAGWNAEAKVIETNQPPAWTARGA